MPLYDNDVVITVSTQHAIICRRRTLADGSISYECARNSDDLEAEAIRAVVNWGEPFLNGHEFTCPPELAQRARWN